MTGDGRQEASGGPPAAAAAPGGGSGPSLEFSVERAEALKYVAAPTLRLGLRIDAAGWSIRSLALNVQLRIAATSRSYSGIEEERLLEVFGTPDRWGTTLRSLLWTSTSLNVAPFESSTVVDLDVPCTYDFEVAAAKYFHALAGGDVPLELLFSGTAFYPAAAGRLQVARISWDREAAFALPIGVWREAVDRAFPNAAWLRIHRDVFDRLYRYKARRVLPSWEAVVDELLPDEA